MKFVKKSIVLSLAMATGLSAMAQDKIIDGYFRIKSGAGKYVNVTGPVSAAPDKEYAEALQSPGSVFYISAVRDGSNYLLKNLRSQGIDVARDEISAEDYVNTFYEITNAGGDINEALINGGLKYGYTSLGRVTVGYILYYVGTSLGNYNSSNDGFVPDDYSAVVDDFNKNVLAKVDFGLRMKPVNADGGVQLYYDIPSLEPVVEWYLAEDTEDHKKRHDVFESAMKSMTNFLLSRSGISLERFRAEDVTLLKDWGYDLGEKYPEHRADFNGETVYDFTFAEIFSDADLLFNWVKMIGYMIVEPSADKYNRVKYLREFDGLSELLKSYDTGRMIIENIPRLQPGIRVFLTDNEGSFDFADASQIGEAGDNGVWILEPTDTDSSLLTLEVKHYNAVENSGKNYTGLYLDFPVATMDERAMLMTLSDVQQITADGMTYNYTELQELGNQADAHVPFIIENAAESVTKLKIINDGLVYEQLPPVVEPEPQPRPDNSFAVSDEEVARQHAPAKREASSNSETMYGVLIDTPANRVMNILGFDSDKPFYAISDHNETVGANDHLSLRTRDGESTIKANEIVYTPSSALTTDESGEALILVGKPSITTGIETVGTEAAETENVLYDLNGVRIEHPQPGRIYILNGKKILVM